MVKEQEPKPISIVEALALARKQFKAATKNSSNPFFKSKYLDLEGTMDAIGDALDQYGLVLVQRPETREVGGSLIQLLITELVHTPSGGKLRGEWILNPAKKDDPQAMGSCTTYARRYSVWAITGIVQSDDDDGNAASGRDAQPAQQARTRQQAKPAEQKADVPAVVREKFPGAKVATVGGSITQDHLSDITLELANWLYRDIPKPEDQSKQRKQWISYALGREITSGGQIKDSEYPDLLSKARAKWTPGGSN